MSADEFLWAWMRWWYRSDYTAIDPRYGTLEDWDRLLAGVHERGMKLLYVLISSFSLFTAQYKRLTKLYSYVWCRCRMDLVANHTSDEVHSLFLSSFSISPSPQLDTFAHPTTHPRSLTPTNSTNGSKNPPHHLQTPNATGTSGDPLGTILQRGR